MPSAEGESQMFILWTGTALLALLSHVKILWAGFSGLSGVEESQLLVIIFWGLADAQGLAACLEFQYLVPAVWDTDSNLAVQRGHCTEDLRPPLKITQIENAFHLTPCSNLPSGEHGNHNWIMKSSRGQWQGKVG